jgi:hypothetical protein
MVGASGHDLAWASGKQTGVLRRTLAKRSGVRGAARGLAGLAVLAAGAAALPSGAAAQCWHPQGNVELPVLGDLNGSGSVNVADALCGVLVTGNLAASLPAPACLGGGYGVVSDVDCSGSNTVSDVQVVIFLSLGMDLPLVVDGNNDGCPNACAPCVSPGQTSCLIGGACVPEEGTDPLLPCLVCRPGAAADWTLKDDGEQCGGGKLCDSGQCVATVPDAPTLLSAIAASGQVTVAFAFPTNTGGAPLTSFRAVCTAGSAVHAATGVGSPLVVSGLTNGVTYDCGVAASNAVGEGAFSGAQTATPFGPPGAPTSVVGAAGVSSISVSFSTPSANGSAIVSYSAECTSSTGGASGSAVGAGSPLTVASLSPGASYTCRVLATNAAGAGPLSAPSATITLGGGASAGETFVFTSCGHAGRLGPSQAQCTAAYASSNLAGQVTVDQGYQVWTVPATGTWRIQAAGAQGGDVGSGGGASHNRGGLGAYAAGELALNAGDTIIVVVGQAGQSKGWFDWGGGGGGASFVTRQVASGGSLTTVSIAGSTRRVSPLLVAGGGAGAHDDNLPAGHGGSGRHDTSGTGAGGTDPAGEAGASSGAGFSGDGVASDSNPTALPRSFLNGAMGAQYAYDGGFGGGGAPYNVGGGGGGYTGGAGAIFQAVASGGWSFKSGLANQNGFDGFRPGHGEVRFTFQPASSSPTITGQSSISCGGGTLVNGNECRFTNPGTYNVTLSGLAQVFAWGAGGGGHCNWSALAGGAGGYTTGVINTSAAGTNSYVVVVGGGGARALGSGSSLNLGGSPGGGGNGCNSTYPHGSGGGGGYSGVFAGSVSHGNSIIVAGGGGGGGGGGQFAGPGGGASGTASNWSTDATTSSAGSGSNHVMPGPLQGGGYTSCSGSDGADGGGGGGGYYGGASQTNCDGCGGGGGSGYFHPSIVSSGSTSAGARGDVQTATQPPAIGTAEYGSGNTAGRGGATCSDGQPGRVVIRMQ